MWEARYDRPGVSRGSRPVYKVLLLACGMEDVGGCSFVASTDHEDEFKRMLFEERAAHRRAGGIRCSVFSMRE